MVTKWSRNISAITDEVAEVLRQIRGFQLVQQLDAGPAWQKTEFVFTKPDGRPLDPHKVTHKFSVIARKNFEGIRLHDLRHTHASLMLQAGVHPKIVSERLGHASVAITLDTYSHVLPGLQENTAKQFSELLDGNIPR